MCGYAITCRSCEYVDGPIDARAFTSYRPSARLAGAVTTNSAVAWAPAPATVKGAVAGVAVHPGGSSRESAPVAGPSWRLAACTCTVCVRAVLPVGSTNKEEAKPTVTPGTTLTSRRSSPRTESAYRKVTGASAETVVPPISSFAVAFRRGSRNGAVLGASADHWYMDPIRGCSRK